MRSLDNDCKMVPEKLPHWDHLEWLALYRRGILVEAYPDDDVTCIPDGAFEGGVDTDPLDFDSVEEWKSWLEARAEVPERWHLEVVRAPLTGDVEGAL